MNENIFKKILIAFCFIFVFSISSVFADEEVVNNDPVVTPDPVTQENPPVEQTQTLSINTSVDVPSSCDVVDIDGVSHTYTADSSDSYIAICAVKVAIDSGAISSTKLSNQYPSMGLFVTAINDREVDPSSQYWALYKNGDYAESGLSTLGIKTGDIISLKLSDFSGVETGDSVSITINSLVAMPSSMNIESSVDVPFSCEVTDTDNVVHTYTSTDSNSYLGICALKKTLESNDINSVKLSNQYPSMGLFVTSINDKEVDPNSQYWALYKNNSYADVGLSILPISTGDIISLKLSDFSGVETGDSVVIKIKSLILNDTNSSNGSSGGSSGGGSVAKEFSTDKAFEFLASMQSADGSYGDQMYTDWVAIALSSSGDATKDKIKEYLISNDIDSSILTDYERRAMALMSLGVNPYNGTNTNYIKKIIDGFDGTQFGDPSLINDDIFAILVLKNAGYTGQDEIIKKDVQYIIGQGKNGSWGSVDMTVAFVEALSGIDNIDGVSEALSLARSFILSNSSSINNPFTASWVMQSGVETDKTKEYLISNQDSDGGIKIDGGDISSRIWATSYAIPAILNKSWDDLLKDFSKIVYDATISKSDNTVTLDNVISEPVLFSEPQIEDFAISTDKTIEKPVLKNEKIKTNIKKDVISTEEFSSDIKPLHLDSDKITENRGFWSNIGGFWLKIKGIFSWLFVSLGF